ncbi:MAG: iron-containing alcohol dehydrogenase [Candidatus Thorarchaeota archaeon]
MRNFNFYNPTRIRFGWGRVNEIGSVVKRNGKKCLLVTVKPFSPLKSLFEKVIMLCEQEGVEVTHFDGVIPNPTDQCVNLGSKLAADNEVDIVLGVGGGSSIDTAKGIAVGATHKEDVWNYRLGQKRIVSTKVLPIIAVPTTAGTGAEVTNMAVIENSEEHFKSALADWSLNPTISIVDPELTLTMPPHITASTGFDAFSHSFEPFINRDASDFIDLYALESLKKIIKYLPLATKDGSNRETREALSFAATLGGLCISNIGTTLPHGIAMAMGGHIPNIVHGESLAIVYPEICRWTWKQAIEKFAIVARLFNPKLESEPNESAAEKCCDEINSFLKEVGLWMNLNDKNVPENILEDITQDTLKLRNYTLHPKVANFEDVNKILKRSYSRED